MTAPLEKIFERIRLLPNDQQDAMALLLLEIIADCDESKAEPFNIECIAGSTKDRVAKSVNLNEFLAAFKD